MKSRGKVIAVNWQTVRAALESDDICVTLKQGHVIAIASVLEFFRWRTRWTGLDDDADILAFTDDLEARLMGCGCGVDCDAVVDCIEEKIDRVTELITKNQTFLEVLNQQIEEAIENYNIVINPPAGGDCRARVWSASRTIVRRLHNDTLDFLEQLEVYANFNEFLAVVAFLPLLDESGIDTLFQLFNYIQENAIEQYSAFYTDEVEDEIACAIFCSVECDAFTLDAVIRAYEQRVMKNVSSLLNIQTYLNALVAGGLPTNALMVDTLHLFALGLAKLGATKILNVFQIDPRAWVRYVNVVRVGLRNEDDSYSEFCDCPPPTWTHTFNFAENEGGWQAVTNLSQWIPSIGISAGTTANYVTGTGWQSGYFRQSDYPNRGMRGVVIRRTNVTGNIKSVSVSYTRTNGTIANPPAVSDVFALNTTALASLQSASPNPLSFSFDVTLSAGTILVYMLCGVNTNTNTADPNGQITILSITLTGTGVNPFLP